jgi:hypothetical protein
MPYTDASFLVQNLATEIPRPLTCSIVAWSGRGAGGHAVREPGHVTLILIEDTGRWCTTDLALPAAGQATININAWRDTPLPLGPAIFRGWQLGVGPAGQARLAAALAEAGNLQAHFAANNVPYSEMSNRRTDSWNCARYAERILVAAGLTVSAGFFVSTPLELTTGRSRIVRWILELRRSNTNPTPWYITHAR